MKKNKAGKKIKVELTEAEAKLLVRSMEMYAEVLGDESCNDMPEEISELLGGDEWETMIPALMEIEMNDPDTEDPSLFPKHPTIDQFGNCTPALHIVNVLLNQLPKGFGREG